MTPDSNDPTPEGLNGVFGVGAIGHTVVEELVRSTVAPKGELCAAWRLSSSMPTIEVAVGRASDHFGPGGVTSQMGERVFGSLAAGERAQVMGDPDTRHFYPRRRSGRQR